MKESVTSSVRCSGRTTPTWSFAALARDGPGLLLPEPEGHERDHDAEEDQEDQRDAVASHERHQSDSPGVWRMPCKHRSTTRWARISAGVSSA